MSIKNARKLMVVLMLGGAFIMLLAYLWKPLFYIGMVVCCSSLIPHFLFNRCPHCGKNLGNNGADYCQFCGKRLDD